MRATKIQVAAAFERWLENYNAHPEEFEEEYGEPEEYGVGAAEYLAKMLREVMA